MSNNALIKEMLMKALADAVPKSMARGIKKIADKQNDPLVSSILGVLTDTLEESGSEAVEAIGETLVSLIDGSDPMAAYKLNQKGVDLSDMVDALQNADAARKDKAAKMTQIMAVVLTDIGAVLSQTALSAIRDR